MAVVLVLVVAAAVVMVVAAVAPTPARMKRGEAPGHPSVVALERKGAVMVTYGFY